MKRSRSLGGYEFQMTKNVSSRGKRHRAISFRDVAKILENDSCALCSMLKRFHSACIQDADVSHIQALCDFHAWAVAGAADAGTAARILLRLLLFEKQQPLPTERCSVCERVAEEENKHSEELLILLEADSEFQDWMRDHGTLCIPHARRLLRRISEQDRHVVLALVAQAARRLENELRTTADNPNSRRSSTVLSRAAEFLRGRRGLAIESPCSTR